MPAETLDPDQILTILRATVPRLTALTEGLTPPRLHTPPAPQSWSVNDVLAHLLACNDVLGGAARRIIEEDHPSWRAMSPRTWQGKSGYHDRTFSDLLRRFVDGRTELMEVLDRLPDESWERTAAVSVPPRSVYERSVRYYGDWLATHERSHLTTLPKIIEAVRGIIP